MPSASADTASISPNEQPGRPPGTSTMNANSSVIHPGQPDNANFHSRRSSQSTVEDYSRVMLEYTQRRMAGFAEVPGADNDRGSSTSHSSRSSNTSGQSGTSTSGILAGQAAGPPPANPKIRHAEYDDDAAVDGV
ncbi:uncharacterized protein DSM5745_00414 [Aspergillus mulundensis]|uniref:Uncharacterized protein n=1 Tax=Aspergillus mulundensis TaxID=1810919 RepID=A0A3D8T3G3_9EURO|nr:hypothetical protein DSM5745_00414 [Aspergillus mulundensis]RDW93092.1 hypothetical protein DSM5745_00414 [Aspergillus mulundensis]